MLGKFHGKILGGEIDRCFEKKDIKSGSGKKNISLKSHYLINLPVELFSNFQ